MKKKVISVLLAGLMVLGLSGCQGGPAEQESGSENASGSGEKTTVKLVVRSGGEFPEGSGCIQQPPG